MCTNVKKVTHFWITRSPDVGGSSHPFCQDCSYQDGCFGETCLWIFLLRPKIEKPLNRLSTSERLRKTLTSYSIYKTIVLPKTIVLADLFCPKARRITLSNLDVTNDVLLGTTHLDVDTPSFGYSPNVLHLHFSPLPSAVIVM